MRRDSFWWYLLDNAITALVLVGLVVVVGLVPVFLALYLPFPLGIVVGITWAVVAFAVGKTITDWWGS